ncbi:hypothetical protein J6A31_06600 [bacterium]|nr:hypothetical protein [bacterium]
MEGTNVLTWRDFPDFYNNVFIQAIAPHDRWTVSDNTKRPIDMHALIHEQKIWGAAFDRGYNPLVDLQTLCNTIPSATNNAYYLDALIDGFVILDIEPKCPDVIKQKFLNLPYVYGETSMSGKGLHLVFDLPKDIIEKYPAAKQKLALKEEHGYYEILLNHMVTFTRNILPPRMFTEDISVFENIFELLAMKQKEASAGDTTIEAINIDIDDIPHVNKLLTPLRAQIYNKTPNDFYNDMSKFEFGITGFYYRALMKLLGKNNKFKDHVYSDEEKAVILYKITSEKLNHRDKHDQIRNNMPWLLYIATCLIAKS